MIEDSPAGGAFLAVKICPEDQAAPGFWDESTLECALARDLALASGGLPADPQGPYWVARFDTVQSAALAARRLQWGLQGFSESTAAHGVLTLLILSGEDVTRAGFDTRLLDEAAGARILVAESAARSLEEIPGLALRPAEDGQQGGARELTWRAADNRTTRDADEQALARFIEQNGRAVYPAEGTATEAGGAAAVAVDVAQRYESEPPPRSRRMLWIGLASAVVVAAVAGGLYFQMGTGEKKTASVRREPSVAGPQTAPNPQPPQGPSTTQATPTGGNVAPPANTGAEKSQPVLTRAQKREEQRKEKAQAQAAAKDQTQPAPQPQPPPQDTKRPEPTRVTGGCQYAPDQIPGLIGLAENSRARRNYKDAQRKLQAVLNCEPGNARAREELELVRQAQAAEGGPSDPE